MKVLHVCESLPGGPASYLQEVLPHQVGTLGRDAVVVLVAQEHVSQLGVDVGCTIETFARKGRDLRSLMSLARAIHRAMTRHRPDIVHLHSSFAGALGRLVAMASPSPVKIVYCAHCWSFDLDPWASSTRVWRLAERMLLPLTDLVVNVSPHERPLLVGAGFPTENVVTVTSGVSDLDAPPPPPRRPSPGEPLRLLFIGRLDEQKGIDLLLREIATIAPSEAVLTIVGAPVVSDGDFEVPPHVDMLGWVPRSRIASLMEHAHAVVMPSRWEGMPLAALETLRAARPLLAAERGPFPHIVEHGVNGLLFDIRKPGFLREALARLANTDLTRMGLAARRTYEAKFAASRMNDALIDAYRSLFGVTQPTEPRAYSDRFATTAS